MKNIQAIFYLATMIGGVLSVASCNNENETITASKQVPLEIQTGSVQTTRSIIEEARYQKNVNMVSLPCMVKKERSLTVE